jgi:hypothetical protein
MAATPVKIHKPQRTMRYCVFESPNMTQEGMRIQRKVMEARIPDINPKARAVRRGPSKLLESRIWP